MIEESLFNAMMLLIGFVLGLVFGYDIKAQKRYKNLLKQIESFGFKYYEGLVTIGDYIHYEIFSKQSRIETIADLLKKQFTPDLKDIKDIEVDPE